MRPDKHMKRTLDIRAKTDPQLSHYETLYTIRRTEELLLEYFTKGLLRGTTHTYLGQEAIAVSALSYLGEHDVVTSYHRSHGHFLAYCNDYKKLIAEIIGDSQGVCYGVGGSQHLHQGNFYSNGILAGMVPVATGMALAEKLKGTRGIAVCFLGDGALGEGVVYESFNLASLWKIPVLYVVENNRYAQSTPVELNLAGSIAGRLKAFHIETDEIESNDIGELLQRFQRAFDYVREERKPFCQIVNTYRAGPHSKGDDHRGEDELRFWKERDPLTLAKKYFQPSDIEKFEKRQDQAIKKYFEPFLNKRSANIPESGVPTQTDDEIIPTDHEAQNGFITDPQETFMVGHLQKVWHALMEENPRMYLIGEDLLDPYGGAFKVSKGLSTRFPGRVLSSPVSEAGIMGLANGMALRGLMPVVEIMFGDFTTLIMDQIANHATKFKRMYGGKANCPVIVRTPMGGYRGYGPTHSQSLEKLYFGVPGLAVVACDAVHDQQLIWERMLKLESPCLYIENKTLYGQKIKPAMGDKIEHFYVRSSESYFPTIALKMIPFDATTDVTLLAYGGMVQTAMEVAQKLYMEEELAVEVVVPAQISPLPQKDILRFLGNCRKIVVLEEGTQRNGWGAELSALLQEKCDGKLSFRRCSAHNTIIPNSASGERAVLPDVRACYELVKETADGV